MKVYVAALLGWEDFDVVGVFSAPDLAKEALGDEYDGKNHVVYVCNLDHQPEAMMVRRYDPDERKWGEWFDE